jgi:hypothetical protein
MPNIGEQLAKRIATDRAERGPFRDLADLRRVRGIGPKTLESMKPSIAVRQHFAPNRRFLCTEGLPGAIRRKVRGTVQEASEDGSLRTGE